MRVLLIGLARYTMATTKHTNRFDKREEERERKRERQRVRDELMGACGQPRLSYMEMSEL